MKKLFLYLLISFICVANLKSQNPVLNYQNFLGPVNSSFDLTSSKVVLQDTFQLLEIGQNLTWDFSQFGGIVNSSQPKITYSFLTKDASWLLDSASNRWHWDNPDFNLVLRKDFNKKVSNSSGKIVDEIEEIYFLIQDTTIIPNGLGYSSTSTLYSPPPSALIDFNFFIKLETGKKIETLPYYINSIILDSNHVDTLGANQTFWTLKEFSWIRKVDAAGTIILPFGEIKNCLKVSDIRTTITKKVNKQSGIETNDTSFIAYLNWIAPNISHCIPVVSIDFGGEKLFGNEWDIMRLNAYIADQQSLGVNQNKKTSTANWFFPNPAKDEVIISDLENAINFKIFGLNGQLIKQNVLNSNRISVEGLPPNLYILEVENQTEKFRSKLVIH